MKGIPMNTYAVLSPTGSKVAVSLESLAPRLDTLAGARIGFVWDYFGNGDQMYEILNDALGEQQGNGTTLISYEQFGNIHGDDEREVIASLPDRLTEARVNALVVGVGV
jgi:hypothetical protein